jgi:hypothetical protein
MYNDKEAFPFALPGLPGTPTTYTGMTLGENAAIRFMAVLINKMHIPGKSFTEMEKQHIAQEAFDYAKAFLTQRNF